MPSEPETRPDGGAVFGAAASRLRIQEAHAGETSLPALTAAANLMRSRAVEYPPPAELPRAGCSKHGDTLVTIELFDRGGKTEVVLTHEKFPSDAARDEHNKGWAGCLDRLSQYVS